MSNRSVTWPTFDTPQDRTLVWNQAHLRQILREYETHGNQYRRPNPLKPPTEPVDLANTASEDRLASVA
jgi:hypothetical protein